MKTFRERYSAAHACRSDEFVTRVVRLCLHRRARFMAPFIVLLSPNYFAPDRELIEAVSSSRSFRDLNDEIRDFTLDERNRSWWRGRLRFRLSTHRLRSLVRKYFRDAAPVPSAPVTDSIGMAN
jgi:hypothetical protein